MKLVRVAAASVALLLASCNAEPLQFNRISDYGEARKIFWRDLYPNTTETLYCGDTVRSSSRRGYNIEHVFPMSWVTNALNCGKRKQCRAKSSTFNRVEADLHNLYPARTETNKQRASFRFGEVNGEKRAFGNDCDFEVNHRARVAEPPPSSRGEVARAMFYMAYEYRDLGLKIFDRQARLLAKWHQEDPPSQLEKQRNDRIEKLQGNRNPFVDNPNKLQELFDSGFFRG